MMHEIYVWLQAHPLVVPITMYTINVMISNMPDPDATSGKGYRWLYGTLHGIIGGVGNVIFAAKSGPEKPK